MLPVAMAAYLPMTTMQ